jgi:hypothetical protein
VPTNFWDVVGGKLADRWAAASLPALAFWFGGLLAWLLDRGGLTALRQPVNWLGRQSTPIQAGIIVAVLLAVVVSGEAVGALTTPALRLIEGYWPSVLRPFRRRLVDRVRKRVEDLIGNFEKLAGPVFENTATEDQRAEYVRLDRLLRRLPANGAYQPTAVGNALRAAEARPVDKYGLDAVAVWSHLWLLLPDGTHKQLHAARGSLDASVGVCIWGLLFLLFAPWGSWAVLAGPVVTVLTYRFVVRPRAEIFADLVEAVFDLYRTALYSQLRWPLPDNPRSERLTGRRVTTYLRRGLDDDKPTFTEGAAADRSR